MTRARRALALAASSVVAAALLAGCSSPVAAAPGCDASTRAEGASTAILMAQAVPEAALIPCVNALPTGWSVASSEIDSAGAELVFAHDRSGGRALVVRFDESCDVGRASPVPSDEAGAQRFETVFGVRGHFEGDRHYTYEGGCTTYAFALEGEGWSAHVNDMSSALSFRTRADIAAMAADIGMAQGDGP